MWKDKRFWMAKASLSKKNNVGWLPPSASGYTTEPRQHDTGTKMNMQTVDSDITMHSLSNLFDKDAKNIH